MLVTWKYRPRDIFIQRLDPRARLIFTACMIVAIVQLWDLRFVLPLAGMAFGYYFLAQIPWRDVRRVWLFIIPFVLFIIGLNALLTGRGGASEILGEQSPILFQSPTLHIPLTPWSITMTITVVKTAFAITQVVRMLSMTALAVPIPYTFDPSLYGTTFHQLRLPDKAAYSIDLAFRFVPTLGRDFMTTLDAQRARGYEVERVKGGLIRRLQKLAPLVVPVTIQAIVNGEEVVDAMDLRAFGVARRTWTHELRYHPRDYAVMGFGIVMMLAAIYLGLTGHGSGNLWVPLWLYRLAGR